MGFTAVGAVVPCDARIISKRLWPRKMPVSSIDFNGLDTLVHGPVRLGVLTVLQVEGPLDFTTLEQAF